LIVSNGRKFVFLHNPKAAGTAFRSAIAMHHDYPTMFWGVVHHPSVNCEIDLAHLRAWELPVVAPEVFAALDDFTGLVFVRDPLPRFLSACAEHFRNFRPDEGFSQRRPETQRRLICRLIRTDLTTAAVHGDHRYIHFSPQRWFTHLGERRIIRHILPLRSGDEDFGPAFALLGLPPAPSDRQNRSVGADWQALVCPEILAFVHAFYRMDYEMLAADPALRSLLPPTPMPAPAPAPPLPLFRPSGLRAALRLMRDSQMGAGLH